MVSQFGNFGVFVKEECASALMAAWRGELDVASLINTATNLEAQEMRPLAAILYRTWLDKTKNSPYEAAVYFNLAATLANLGEKREAAAAYRRAIEILPDFVQPHINLANVLEQIGQVDEAIAEWVWVTEHTSEGSEESKSWLRMALNNLGRILESKKKYADAEAYLTRSLGVDPGQRDVLHHWVYQRQKQCEWPIYVDVPGVSPQFMREATSALAMIAVTDDPEEQLDAAHRYAESAVEKNLPVLAPSKSYGHKKLRIGYCSSDFCLHPVSMLMVELFELHDRERFEVYGYCWSPEDGSDMRGRIKTSMDHFHRINGLDDARAAELIRSHEIDILVDLQGQTAGARVNIMARRPAPIQITYLGLPATTGLSFIDYVIADRFLIPEDLAPYYSEKPLYMPDIYQVSDRKRSVGPAPTRAECGLPEDAFVFCSFNNNSKYTPEVFSAWMRILQQVPGSVLWLLADNVWAQQNLTKEAEAQGIEPGRLIFAGRTSPENYLARYAVADLFLDTFPFNAGTTANDALWMELPVLTRSGRAFASRMAGALLTAAKLSELITYDLKEYEERAVFLAKNPVECTTIRERLRVEKISGPLFDTHKFVRSLEDKLIELNNG